MSDRANPGKLASSPLASAGEFDDRLKRTDEDRWLAARYAPGNVRPLLVAIYLLDLELRRALAAKEAMLGKIRIQWWRETVEQIAGKGAIRRHDLAEEIARVTAGRRDLIDPINDLIDRYDDIIDDHLNAGGHRPHMEHADRHIAAETSSMRLAGLALDPTAGREHLDALARCGAARVALVGGLPDADQRWAEARNASRRLPAKLWPAIAHLAALYDPYRVRDNPRTADKAPIMKRWRMLLAVARRRL